MNRSAVFLMFLLFCFFHTQVKSQTEDFQSWNSVSAKVKINKKLSLGGAYEVRIKNNASAFEDQAFTINSKLKLFKFLAFRGGYRLMMSRSIKDGDSKEHRYFTDIILKTPFKRFNISLRERYQYEYSNYYNNEFSFYHFHHLRHKLSLSYDIRKLPLEPFVEGEAYQSLNNPFSNGIVKTRLTLGLSSKITDYMWAEVYYRFQNKNNYLNKNKNTYILGAGLKFNLN